MRRETGRAQILSLAPIDLSQPSRLSTRVFSDSQLLCGVCSCPCGCLRFRHDRVAVGAPAFVQPSLLFLVIKCFSY